MPKRILLATFGSLGDLHPFLAIAVELNLRGHHPVIASSESHRSRVLAAGIDFAAVRPDPNAGEGDLMDRIMDINHGPEVLIRELMMPHLADTAADLESASEGADLIVSHALTFPAQMIAEKRGIPWVGTVMAPLSLFSVYDWPVIGQIPLLAKLRPLGPRFYRPILAAAKRTVRPWSLPVVKLRDQMGLPPTKLEPMFESQFSPHLNLALFSRALADPQPDWPARTIVTGFPFYKPPTESAPSAELEAFLNAGDPPIIFTLGSAAVLAAGDFYRQSVDAARQLGKRALLLVGSDPRNREGIAASTDVGIFEYAPYAAVFPRAAAIVHQGGVGTTGEAMRSGRPMLVTPYAFDQPDNGARITSLGIGRTLARRRYRVSTAVRELGHIIGEPTYAARASDIAAIVRAERGAKAAADAIEALLGGTPADVSLG